MAGIQNLNITFQMDGNRSARNKLSSMGGIMSSSEELMQAAMPMIQELTKPQPQEFGLGGVIGAGLNFLPKIAGKVLEKGINPLVSGMQKIDKARGPGMGGMNYVKPRMKGGKIVSPGSFTKKNNDSLFPQNYVDVTQDAVKFRARMVNNFGSLALAQDKLREFMNGLVKTDNEDASEDKKETTKLLEESLGKSVKELANEVGIQTPKNRSVSDITREYMRVAKNTAIADPGSFAQRFGKSILMGLTTELATKPTGGKGSGIQDRENSSDARLQLATKLISENQMSGPEAFEMADELLKNLFPLDATAQTAAAGSGSGSGSGSGASSGATTSTTTKPKFIPNQIITQGGNKFKIDADGVPQQIMESA